jgi:hypothetical protein
MGLGILWNRLGNSAGIGRGLLVLRGLHVPDRIAGPGVTSILRLGTRSSMITGSVDLLVNL